MGGDLETDEDSKTTHCQIEEFIAYFVEGEERS